MIRRGRFERHRRLPRLHGGKLALLIACLIQTALELGCIYALVALALFLSYSILNIADLSTDGCFT